MIAAVLRESGRGYWYCWDFTLTFGVIAVLVYQSRGAERRLVGSRRTESPSGIGYKCVANRDVSSKKRVVDQHLLGTVSAIVSRSYVCNGTKLKM